jgi:hypothetical protein
MLKACTFFFSLLKKEKILIMIDKIQSSFDKDTREKKSISFYKLVRVKDVSLYNVVCNYVSEVIRCINEQRKKRRRKTHVRFFFFVKVRYVNET